MLDKKVKLGAKPRIGVLSHCGFNNSNLNVSWYSSIRESFDIDFNMGDLISYESMLRIFPTASFIFNPSHFSECDLVVVRSNNCLWGNAFTKIMSTQFEGLQHLTCPILVLGAGGQSEHSKTIRSKSLRLLSFFAERAPICVREYVTAELLKRHGITNVAVTGCPTMYHYKDPFRRIAPRTHGYYVIPTRLCLYDSNKNVLGDFVNKFLACDVRLVSQGEPQEKRFAFKHFVDTETMNIHKKWYADVTNIDFSFFDKYHFFLSVNEYRQCFNSAKIVAGFRLHSTLLALSMGIPSLLVTYDSRTRSYVDAFCIPSIDVTNLNNFNVEDLDNLDFSTFETKRNEHYLVLKNVLDNMGVENALSKTDQILP